MLCESARCAFVVTHAARAARGWIDDQQGAPDFDGHPSFNWHAGGTFAANAQIRGSLRVVPGEVHPPSPLFFYFMGVHDPLIHWSDCLSCSRRRRRPPRVWTRRVAFRRPASVLKSPDSWRRNATQSMLPLPRIERVPSTDGWEHWFRLMEAPITIRPDGRLSSRHASITASTRPLRGGGIPAPCSTSRSRVGIR